MLGNRMLDYSSTAELRYIRKLLKLYWLIEKAFLLRK